MLKRQDSLLSSSYLRTPPPPPPPPKSTGNRHAKLTGCFPAIFKLISSKYHNRKKLLTFGKKSKSPRNGVSTPSTDSGSLQASITDAGTDLKFKEDNHYAKEEDKNLESRKLTADITPRSPMLPPELRLLNNDVSGSFAGNARTAPERPALVARLMGLDDQPSMTVKKDEKVHLMCNEEEKRRRLLQALEKCSEDLVSLKKVIMAVQLVEDKNNKKSAPSEIFQPRTSDTDSDGDDSGDDVDYIGRSPPFRRYNYTAKLHYNGVTPQQRKKLIGKKPREEDGFGISFIDKVQAESLKMKCKAANPNIWSSKAMIQSVEEVCNDIMWGEKRELQNLELVLDNYISRDLIEEVVFDLGFHRPQPRLPFDTCRRRISF